MSTPENWLLQARSPEQPTQAPHPTQQIIAIIGAGAMGAGIAQVAALAGHTVRVLDVQAGAAAKAIERIAATLRTLMAKGRLAEASCDAAIARLHVADDIAALSDAVLAIEVIVEQLAPKRALLQELAQHLSPQAILASNTSSISITALANGVSHPERVVGMHFFNPVPLMKLVEVVSGAETSPTVARLIHDLSLAWGKTPVYAKSTPGFIVNRIARPFYAEALNLLQEQAATPAQLDGLARAIGFRMGPCELMDLIGHDVNYAVTCSVYEANYSDRRYLPSLVQKALVDGGRLGRKSGKGFYAGEGGTTEPVAVIASSTSATLPAITVHGDSLLSQALVRRLRRKQIEFSLEPSDGWQGLQIGDFELHLCDGRSAAQLAAQLTASSKQQQLGVLDWVLSEDDTEVSIAFAPAVDSGQQQTVLAALVACGLQAIILRDVPGLFIARTISMLINEAADAVYQGVCDENSADLAMKLGTNYPAGPFDWLRQIGIVSVVQLLDHLFDAYRSERYRISPHLQQSFWKAQAV